MNQTVENTEVPNIVLFKQKYKEIVQELVQIRKEIPMTQDEVAEWLSVDRRKIIQLEKGEINISLLLRYADKLSVNIELKFNIT